MTSSHWKYGLRLSADVRAGRHDEYVSGTRELGKKRKIWRSKENLGNAEEISVIKYPGNVNLSCGLFRDLVKGTLTEVNRTPREACGACICDNCGNLFPVGLVGDRDRITTVLGLFAGVTVEIFVEGNNEI